MASQRPLLWSLLHLSLSARVGGERRTSALRVRKCTLRPRHRSDAPTASRDSESKNVNNLNIDYPVQTKASTSTIVIKVIVIVVSLKVKILQYANKLYF